MLSLRNEERYKSLDRYEPESTFWRLSLALGGLSRSFRKS